MALLLSYIEILLQSPLQCLIFEASHGARILCSIQTLHLLLSHLGDAGSQNGRRGGSLLALQDHPGAELVQEGGDPRRLEPLRLRGLTPRLQSCVWLLEWKSVLLRFLLCAYDHP